MTMPGMPTVNPVSWESPEPVSRFQLKEINGDTIIWLHGGTHAAWPTRDFGTKAVPRGTLIVLTGRYMNEVFEDQMLWGALIPGQLAGLRNGSRMLARVRYDKGVSFDPATAYEQQLANHWVSMNPGRMEELSAKAVTNFYQQSQNQAAAPQYQAPTQPQPIPQYATTPVPANAPAVVQQAQAGYVAAQPAPAAYVPSQQPTPPPTMAVAPPIAPDGYPSGDVSPTAAVAAYGGPPPVMSVNGNPIYPQPGVAQQPQPANVVQVDPQTHIVGGPVPATPQEAGF